MRNPFQAMIENQVANFQAQLTEAMAELAEMEIEGSAGGGAVKVTLTGGGEVLRVAIDPEVLKEQDVELLQDLVCAALRDGLTRVSETKREKIMRATPLGALGMELPDVF